MANPIFSKSMSIVFTIDGSTRTVACATDFSLSINKDMIDIACLTATGAKQSVPDLYGWTVSFSGLRMETDSLTDDKIGYDELANLIVTSDEKVDVYLLPDVSSNNYLKGSGYISSITMDGGVGSPVSYSGEVTGSGALSQQTTS